MKKQAARKQPRSQDIVPLLIANVQELAGSMRRWGDRIAGESGQTQARWQVLSATAGEGQTVAQLARRLGLTRQSVQRTADLLLEQGLLESRKNPANRRSPLLRLRPAGRSVLERLSRTALQYHRELAHGLTLSELEAAQVTLRKMCLHLERDLRKADR